MAEVGYRLNFARSWRPRAFKEVVGQTTPVQLLANSIARDIYFPVYLLSGMRGSGKTTVGRLFAAALNCERLVDFCAGSCQWNDLPCGACRSCQLMQRGEHPDFIEVDAASYTGVENVRQIIDEAQFLPVVGRKKVYLVDEAHMLSKSAFNAFLKMLEEPPASVIFLLATTEAHKIIDTVRSRSFQLFFDPLPFDTLADYLIQVAQKEGISCEREAVEVIAQQSEGSVRDALTAFEQAGVAAEQCITIDLVRGLFGLVSFAAVFDLYHALFVRDIPRVFDVVSEFAGQRRSLAHGWSVLVEVATGALWFEKSLLMPNLRAYEKDFQRLIAAAPQGFFARALDLFFKYELLLQKTQNQKQLFERMIIACLEFVGGSGEVAVQFNPVEQVKDSKGAGAPVSSVPLVQAVMEQPLVETSGNVNTEAEVWKKFLAQVRPLCKDPILLSVLASGCFQGVDSKVVRVMFPKSFAFYQELLINARLLWQPVLEECFGGGATLLPFFSTEGEDAGRVRPVAGHDKGPTAELVKKNSAKVSMPVQKRKQMRGGTAVDISDVNAWPTANMLVGLFPGSVKLYEE
ncbi:MAG: polymerase III gamma subunit protein [candidate division TM6 bacterium GW2011_GWF2_43_17]|nr:MAG: polymerase III gamma subunit protein [candidate division TM6 bacterium GW2011_GWF2_43_17]HAU30478.1 DNA polymerase III, subunit gamma and tau [Candidatus Dependentiae bacterium]